MYVILNIHRHIHTVLLPSSTYKTQSVKFVKSIWTQVAKYFKVTTSILYLKRSTGKTCRHRR
ncbi:MAG: cellulase family glycosylhydrolase [[Eubacterium] siraeum]